MQHQRDHVTFYTIAYLNPSKFGNIPQYQEFPDPEVNTDDILIKVKAAVSENFDKMVASGKHYSSQQMFPTFPAIAGYCGVGTITDGTLVAFRGKNNPMGQWRRKQSFHSNIKII